MVDDRGEAEPSSHPSPEARAQSSSWRPMFHVGGCGIYFCWQKPAVWPGNRQSKLQIVVSAEDTEAETWWRQRNGKSGHSRLAGSQVWLIPAGIWHAAIWHRPAGLVVIQLDRAAVLSATAKPLKDISVEPVRRYIERAPLVGELCTSLWDECRRTQPIDRLTVGGMAQALAGHVLRSHFAPRDRNDPRQWLLLRGQLASVRAHVENHLSEDLSLSVLAGVAGLSPSYFGQVFRAATGLPPAAYVAGVRVIHAREMLRRGEHSATEVAHLVGFSSQQLMTVTFRRLLGTLPSDYLPRPERNRLQILTNRKRVRWQFW